MVLSYSSIRLELTQNKFVKKRKKATNRVLYLFFTFIGIEDAIFRYLLCFSFVIRFYTLIRKRRTENVQLRTMTIRPIFLKKVLFRKLGTTKKQLWALLVAPVL